MSKRGIGSAVGLLLAIVGLGGIAGDVTGWGAVIMWLGPDTLLVLAGFAIVVWANGQFLRRQLGSVVPTWSLTFHTSDIWPFRRRIPLERAAQLAYERLKDDRWGKAARKFQPEGILAYMAAAIVQRGKEVIVYGIRQPSEKLERIPPEEFQRGVITAGGSIFERYGEREPFYTDLHIKRVDLKRRLAEMKNVD